MLGDADPAATKSAVTATICESELLVRYNVALDTNQPQANPPAQNTQDDSEIRQSVLPSCYPHPTTPCILYTGRTMWCANKALRILQRAAMHGTFRTLQTVAWA